METTHGPAYHPQSRRGGARRGSRRLPSPRGGTSRKAQGPRLEGDPQAPGRPARAALTEAGAGGVQLLREEAVIAEALQGIPGGDDRHHHQPAAQHVQEPAHPPGRLELRPPGPGRVPARYRRRSRGGTRAPPAPPPSAPIGRCAPLHARAT